MAGYLILLYVDESDELPEDLLAAHGRFQEANGAVLRGGGWLAPTTTATAVRGKNLAPDYTPGDDAEVTDGPFVETKEALGGYYMVDVPDLDAALAVARQVPAPSGGVEVRPLMPTS
ncbi:YciI family protein [Actinomycetospora atypica]|uniref:YciI family protein n=1 Tax=Actinomycetospora atypica TaxID=1290095 RepID=A0ABV9YM20_9PSEU